MCGDNQINIHTSRMAHHSGSCESILSENSNLIKLNREPDTFQPILMIDKDAVALAKEEIQFILTQYHNKLKKTLGSSTAVHRCCNLIQQIDVEMDPPTFTMKSVTNEKTEPEQARKRKTKTTRLQKSNKKYATKIWIIHKVGSILVDFGHL